MPLFRRSGAVSAFAHHRHQAHDSRAGSRAGSRAASPTGLSSQQQLAALYLCPTPPSPAPTPLTDDALCVVGTSQLPTQPAALGGKMALNFLIKKVSHRVLSAN
jgi:hypothetical protein